MVYIVHIVILLYNIDHSALGWRWWPLPSSCPPQLGQTGLAVSRWLGLDSRCAAHEALWPPLTTSPSSPTVLLRTNQTWWTALGQSSQHSIHNRITIRHSDTVNYCLATTVNSPVLCVKLVDNSSVLQWSQSGGLCHIFFHLTSLYSLSSEVVRKEQREIFRSSRSHWFHFQMN